jgi:hemolysin-activating ACP:hemolysin acyltransferase
MVMRAMLLNQYRLLHVRGHRVSAASWAFLSETTKAKFLFNPPRLEPNV